MSNKSKKEIGVIYRMDPEVETSIQASKKPKTEKALAGLAAGRARLAEINKAKADAKAQMLKEAIVKKTQRKQERDAKLLKEIDLAIGELSEDGEYEEPAAPIVPVKVKPSVAVVALPAKAPTKASAKVSARGHPSAPRSSMGSKGNDKFPLLEPESEEEVVVKKPKKKVIRYVEESSSEEEEIVYVKREKKAPKTVYHEAPQQRPQIVFY